MILQFGDCLLCDAQLPGDIFLSPTVLESCSPKHGTELVWDPDNVHRVNLRVDSYEINLPVVYDVVNFKVDLHPSGFFRTIPGTTNNIPIDS